MRAVIATQHPDLTLSLELLIHEIPGLVVVGVASDYEGLLALANATRPGLVVVDWRITVDRAGDVVRDLCAGGHAPIIVALVDSHDQAQRVKAWGASESVDVGAGPERMRTVLTNLASRGRSWT